MADINELEDNPQVEIPEPVEPETTEKKPVGRPKKEKPEPLSLSLEELETLTGSIQDAQKYNNITFESALEAREHIAAYVAANHPKVSNMFMAMWGNSYVFCEEYRAVEKVQDKKSKKVHIRKYDDLKIIKEKQNIVNKTTRIRDKVWAPRIGAYGSEPKWYLENPFDLFMEAHNRREYSDVVFKCFAPTEEGKRLQAEWEETNSQLPIPEYNRFKGFPVEPDSEPNPQERCRLILNHLRDVICNGDYAVYDWVLHWIANKFQNPDAAHKNRTALAMTGGQGVGKSMFVHFLGSIIGDKQYLVVNDYNLLIQEFTVIKDEHLLVFCDEAGFNQVRSVMNKIKPLISDTTVEKNQKYLDSKQIQFAGDLIFATNEKMAAPLESDDRRYCVLEIKKKFSQAEKARYFSALKAEMDGDGKAAFYAYCLQLDLDNWFSMGNVLDQAPDTEARTEQKLMYQDDVSNWWLWCLENRTLGNCAIDGRDSQIVNWDGCVGQKIPKKVLMLSFLNWCKLNNPKGRYSQQEIVVMKKVNEMCASMQDTGTRISTEGIWAFLSGEGKRLRAIVLPPIEEARENWTTHSKIPDYDWGDEVDDEEAESYQSGSATPISGEIPKEKNFPAENLEMEKLLEEKYEMEALLYEYQEKEAMLGKKERAHMRELSDKLSSRPYSLLVDPSEPEPEPPTQTSWDDDQIPF